MSSCADASGMLPGIISRLATQSLLYEVFVTPKPGLVDRRNSGSHPDMDYLLFIDSALALSAFWRAFYDLGAACPAGCPELDGLFDRARALGLQAEDQMLRATGGINTHKGIVFSLGLLCVACGQLQLPVSARELCAQAGTLAQHALRDFAGAACSSTGLSLHRAHAVGGIRAEAAAAFPSVTEIALPAFKQHLASGANCNDAAVCALMYLISSVEDTTLIKRSSLSRARAIRQEVAAFLTSNPSLMKILAKAEQLDAVFIQSNLSAGGCADLLGITFFLWLLQREDYLI